MKYLRFKSNPEMVYTYDYLNLLAVVVGLLVIWFASHSWVAMVGGFVGSWHFSRHARAEDFDNDPDL